MALAGTPVVALERPLRPEDTDTQITNRDEYSTEDTAQRGEAMEHNEADVEAFLVEPSLVEVRAPFTFSLDPAM